MTEFERQVKLAVMRERQRCERIVQAQRPSVADQAIVDALLRRIINQIRSDEEDPKAPGQDAFDPR